MLMSCVSAVDCPHVFSIGDNGTAVAIDSDVTGEVVSTAQEAKEGCPVGAIEEQ